MKKPDPVPLGDWIIDRKTDPRLLPPSQRRLDNLPRRALFKRAVRAAMEARLSPTQRRRLEEHYGLGLSKSEIALREKSSCSAVGKSIRLAEQAIREYAGLYLNVYEQLKREAGEDLAYWSFDD